MSGLVSAASIPELRKRVIFTLLMLFVYRMGVQIAVEHELITVAGKLKKDATSAVFIAVPAISASTIEVP